MQNNFWWNFQTSFFRSIWQTFCLAHCTHSRFFLVLSAHHKHQLAPMSCLEIACHMHRQGLMQTISNCRRGAWRKEPSSSSRTYQNSSDTHVCMVQTFESTKEAHDKMFNSVYQLCSMRRQPLHWSVLLHVPDNTVLLIVNEFNMTLKI